MRVLVTGATGFIGGHLISHLKSAGHTPVALVRPSSQTDALKADGIEMFIGDLHSGSGVANAIHNVDAIVHAAGGGYVRHPKDYLRNNAATTRQLVSLVEAHQPNLKRFVLISSAAASGPLVDGQPTAPLSLYGQSKAMAERAVQEAQSSFPVTILRPVAVYGPGDTRLLPLMKSIRRGLACFPLRATQSAWLHVDDCCEAIVQALDADQGSGRIYQLDDGVQQTRQSIVEAMIEGLGCKEPIIIRLPMWFMKAVASAVELQARVFGTPALLTRDKLKDIGRLRWDCDATEARRELQWAPSRQFSTQMPQTVRATLEAGLLDSQTRSRKNGS